jgi:hypothetical protein
VDDSKAVYVSPFFYYFQFYLYAMNDTERSMTDVAEGENYYEVVHCVALLRATPTVLHLCLAKHGVCQLPNKYGKGKKSPSPMVPYYSLGKNKNCGPTLFPRDFSRWRARGFLHAVSFAPSPILRAVARRKFPPSPRPTLLPWNLLPIVYLAA